MEAARKIIKNEIKHHTYGPIITSFIVYLLIFVLFGLVELKKDIVIMIVERFLPLMGIILISPCFQYEMDYGIEDVIRSKSTGILTTYLIRLILRIFIYGMLTFLFIALIKITDSQVEAESPLLSLIKFWMFLMLPGKTILKLNILKQIPRGTGMKRQQMPYLKS